MANNEGTPLHGDRSAWNTTDHAGEHARDIDDSALLRHLPAPATLSNFAVDDGTNWVAKTLAETSAILEADIDHGNIQGLSTGADHSYIDQSVISGSAPTLDGTNFTGIPDGAMDTDYVEVAGDTMTGGLILEREATIATLELNTYSDVNWHGSFYFGRRWRGTKASPTVVVNGDVLFYFDVWGYDGDSIERAGQFKGVVDGVPADGFVPLKWQYNTSTTGYALVIRDSGAIGINTNTPSRILDCNQGGGNMIADGYDTHSLAKYKEDITEISGMLDALIKAPPKEYRRVPHVSADELKRHLVERFGKGVWVKEFGGEVFEGRIEGDEYRGGKMRTIKNKEMLKEADKFADEKRAERVTDRKRYGLVADDPDVLKNLPHLVARDDEGNPIGISISDLVGALHAGLNELAGKVEALGNL